MGWEMPGRKYVSSATDDEYGYSGDYSRKNDATNWNEFQYRNYDSRIGRWLSPDPMRQYHSPYVGMGNSWINFLDPTGLWSTDTEPPKSGDWGVKEDGSTAVFQVDFWLQSGGVFALVVAKLESSIVLEEAEAIGEKNMARSASDEALPQSDGGHAYKVPEIEQVLSGEGRLKLLASTTEGAARILNDGRLSQEVKQKALNYNMQNGEGAQVMKGFSGLILTLASGPVMSLGIEALGFSEAIAVAQSGRAARSSASLGAGRNAAKQWLQGAGNLERGTLVENIESAGFRRMSPTTSPVSVFERGGMRVRLDPPQSGTPYNHMHLEYGGNSYNTFLNPVNYRSPAAHIPIR